MKTIKSLAFVAVALALASCNNVELDSAKQRSDNAPKPLEFSLVVKNQTRAGQIYSTNLSKLYMATTGTFYSAAGQEIANPTLELTKGEQGWSYTYNGNPANTILYWPMEGQENAQFRAWYYDGSAAAAHGELDNKAATLDAVGAYTALNYVSGAQVVPLNMYHAVSKAEFKVKVLEKSEDGPYKIKVDIKGASLHNMAYKASAYVLPESEAPMGAFTLADGTRALLAEPESHSFLTQSSEAAAIGSLFVMPQEIDAQDLSAGTWNKPYISILAQIRVDEGENNVPIFPKNATASDYAWLAVPLPADFEGFEAHHKYIFTINLRDDAMGKADKDQAPNKDEEEGPKGEDTEDLVPADDRGEDVTIEGRSAFSVNVTVEDVFDFDEYPEGQQPATGIETGGSVPEDENPLATPFTLQALTAGTIQVNNPKSGMQYSKNGGDKTPVTTTAIDVVEGDKVAFYGNGTAITSYYNPSTYSGTKITGGSAQVKVFGNIMSLVDETGYATATALTGEYAFNQLFFGNENLTDASGLLLPATTLTNNCYSSLFYDCTNLSAAPALPATTLSNYCYSKMFTRSGITSAPALPATTLAEGCYNLMFEECGITDAPALPATTLAQACYKSMFHWCSSLTTAPELPATTLASECYSGMFRSCTSLIAAPALPATTLASSCYASMFYGCSFTTAPELPATTLVEGCYRSMFMDCSNLNTVTCLATAGLNASNCTQYWLEEVAETGTFYVAEGMVSTWSASGKVPSGWTIVGPQIVDLSALSANYTAIDGDILINDLGAKVKISIADGATITLRDMSITYSSNGADYAGLTCLGDATIVIADGTTNTVVGGLDGDGYSNWPGIFVPAGKTLTINGNTGVLNARRGGDDVEDGSPAGIGASWKNPCGNIVINGGVINAEGGGQAAGIGGCCWRGCGDITINGGTVTATGHLNGTGIGLGGTTNANSITSLSGGNITITGGTVIATGGECGAGIGTGFSDHKSGNTMTITLGNILISGGTVTATGGFEGAGIGTGLSYDVNSNSCGDITITGGTVTATGGYRAAGIGAGYQNGSAVNQCGDITITSGVTRVTATKGDVADNCIGHGRNSTCGTVTVGGAVGAISTSPYTYQP